MPDESKAKGGRARDLALSSQRKREIAKKAAVARWGEKPLQATHKGNFKEEFGFDVDCYVLNDATKTAVISQTGLGYAIGLAARGHSIRKFANGQVMAEFVGTEILEKLESPLKFQYRPAGTENLVIEANGYDVTLLIDICKAVVSAEVAGKLTDRQAPVMRQAHLILGASAKAGIKGLVYALAGYSPAIEEVIAAFKAFVREEAREYEKEFPPLLYKEWQRLYEIKGPISRNWKGMHLTIDHVYYPLARSQGRILELARESRNASGETRRKKLHQFLSEVGVKALRTHLGQVLGLARISRTREQYEQNIDMLFGDPLDRRQTEMNYETGNPSSNS